MDNFDLRKFLAESRQPVQETAIEENDVAGTIVSNMNSSFNSGFEDGKSMVAEYVTEALKGESADAVYEIIEARCNRAAMEMKMEVVAEILEAYDGRINELEENAVFKEMLDETKMANIKEIRQGLYEMAAELKETYKETYMPEEAVEEGEETVEEGKTLKVSQIKFTDGPIGNGFAKHLKKQDEIPVPPPLPPDVNDAIKAYLASDEDMSAFEKEGTRAYAATKALVGYVLHNKKLAAADKGYYINQFNTMVSAKKKGKPAPPPLPAGAKKGRVRAPKGTPPPPPPTE